VWGCSGADEGASFTREDDSFDPASPGEGTSGQPPGRPGGGTGGAGPQGGGTGGTDGDVDGGAGGDTGGGTGGGTSTGGGGPGDVPPPAASRARLPKTTKRRWTSSGGRCRASSRGATMRAARGSRS